MPRVTRRSVLVGLSAAGAAAVLRPALFGQAAQRPLEEFRYDQVRVTAAVPVAQRLNVTEVLLGLSDDSLLAAVSCDCGQGGTGREHRRVVRVSAGV